MSRFTTINRTEFEEFLLPRGFSPVVIQGTAELVYGKIFYKGNHRISLRIYSTINPNGISRERGADAIRIIPCIQFDTRILWVGKIQKILRIQTWRNNLQKAINHWDDQWFECPICKQPMILRKGQHGDFWGCSTYSLTKCQGKANVKTA